MFGWIFEIVFDVFLQAIFELIVFLIVKPIRWILKTMFNFKRNHS